MSKKRNNFNQREKSSDDKKNHQVKMKTKRCDNIRFSFLMCDVCLIHNVVGAPPARSRAFPFCVRTSTKKTEKHEHQSEIK